MATRIITMNLQTRKIAFAELTPQEKAELRAITEDFRRRFDLPQIAGGNQRLRPAESTRAPQIVDAA